MSSADYLAAVEYRPVGGFPGYRVGDDGTVWSSKRGPWRELKRQRDTNGYLFVSLQRCGKRHLTSVHTIVLRTFVGPRPEGKECAHDNGNKADPRLSNLAWKTHKENEADKLSHGTRKARKARVRVGPGRPRGQRSNQSNLTDDDVREIRRLAIAGAPFRHIADQFGVSGPAVFHAARGDTWKHVPGEVLKTQRKRGRPASQH